MSTTPTPSSIGSILSQAGLRALNGKGLDSDGYRTYAAYDGSIRVTFHPAVWQISKNPSSKADGLALAAEVLTTRGFNAELRHDSQEQPYLEISEAPSRTL